MGDTEPPIADDYIDGPSACPRALFVTGLPPDDTTLTVTRGHLVAVVGALLRRGAPPPPHHDQHGAAPPRRPLQFGLFFDRNVHRKIRNGAFLVMFETPEDGADAWARLLNVASQQQRQSRAITEGTLVDAVSVEVPAAALSVADRASRADGPDLAQPTKAVGAAATDESTTSVTTTTTAADRTTEMISLCFSRSAGKLRDHFFPHVPYSLRRQVRLDPTATYSLTDLPSALRMAQLARVLLAGGVAATTAMARPLRVLDAFACCGGNTLGFALSGGDAAAACGSAADASGVVVELTAVELDAGRCEMLKWNTSLLLGERRQHHQSPLHIVNGCCIEVLADAVRDSAARPAFDVVFFDPPWGGTGYSAARASESTGAAAGAAALDLPPLDVFPRFDVSRRAAQALGLGAGSDDDRRDNGAGSTDPAPAPCTVSVSFDDLVVSLVCGDAARRRVASVVMAKVPATADAWITQLAERCVMLGHAATARERPFPFVCNFGASVRVVCIVQNAHFDRVSGVATNGTLDALVGALVGFNQTVGQREHRPRFYDFEKRRWVDLKKWKGSKEPASQ